MHDESVSRKPVCWWLRHLSFGFSCAYWAAWGERALYYWSDIKLAVKVLSRDRRDRRMEIIASKGALYFREMSIVFIVIRRGTYLMWGLRMTHSFLVLITRCCQFRVFCLQKWPMEQISIFGIKPASLVSYHTRNLIAYSWGPMSVRLIYEMKKIEVLFISET